jgi:FHS family glucose/mannose:H+ symporter-like MFS transporter
MSETLAVARIRTGLLSGAAYSGMFGFGIVMALLGAILPLISQRLHFDLAHAGNLFLAMNGAMLVTTVAIGPLLDRFGMKTAFVVAPLFVAGALVLIAGIATFGGLVPAVVLLGTGGGALNQATNTLIADLHEDPKRKSAALNLLGVFFGVGALFIPFTIGSLLNALGLSDILYIGAAVSLIPMLSARLRFPTPRQSQGVSFGDVLRLARQPLVVVFALLLFCESGNEFLLGGYVTTFLTRNLGASMAAASYLLAAYWGAVMIGRVILSRVLLHTSGGGLILASALGVVASVALLLLAPALPVAAVAIVLLGFSIAAIFPTTLGLAGSRYPSHSGTVFSILIGVALSGGMTLPWVAGQIAGSRGVGAGLVLAIMSALSIAGFMSAAARLMRREN